MCVCFSFEHSSLAVATANYNFHLTQDAVQTAARLNQMQMHMCAAHLRALIRNYINFSEGTRFIAFRVSCY